MFTTVYRLDSVRTGIHGKISTRVPRCSRRCSTWCRRRPLLLRSGFLVFQWGWNEMEWVVVTVVVVGLVMEGNILERQSLLKALVVGNMQMGWGTEFVYTAARVRRCQIRGELIVNELAYCNFLTLLPDHLVLSACKCLQPFAIVDAFLFLGCQWSFRCV